MGVYTKVRWWPQSQWHNDRWGRVASESKIFMENAAFGRCSSYWKRLISIAILVYWRWKSKWSPKKTVTVCSESRKCQAKTETHMFVKVFSKVDSAKNWRFREFHPGKKGRCHFWQFLDVCWSKLREFCSEFLDDGRPTIRHDAIGLNEGLGWNPHLTNIPCHPAANWNQEGCCTPKEYLKH